jgi:exonuclease SbcD
MLRGYYESLDPQLPTVVTAHMSLDRALAGIEQELLIGYTLTFPVEMFIDPRIDYVALGHIHRHQVIREQQPAITYAGSLERVDFGEEKEDKGFIHVVLERKKVDFKFHSIDPRPFVTVEADLTNSENPTARLVEKIEKAIKPGCVLRVRYKINQEQLEQIDEDALQSSGRAALTFKIYPEIVSNNSRARLPQLTETSVSSPISALETYLDEVAPERKDRLRSAWAALNGFLSIHINYPRKFGNIVRRCCFLEQYRTAVGKKYNCWKMHHVILRYERCVAHVGYV